MPIEAAKLKARLQKISEAKDLGKLTYKITGGSAGKAHTSVAALILHFEKFAGVGTMQFDRLSKSCGDAKLAEDLFNYFENQLSGYDPLAEASDCGRGDIISVPISVPGDVPQLEKAAKDLIFLIPR